MSNVYSIWHYDGTSAVRHAAQLVSQEHGFEVISEGQPKGEAYSWNDLVYRGEKKDGPFYGHISRNGWQILLDELTADALFGHLPKPKKYGGFIDKIGLVPASIALVGISAAVIFTVMAIPQYLAPFIPMSWEKSLGDAMIGDLGNRMCKTPDSRAALTAMMKRLDPKGDPLDINIANINMVNAVALPGGKVVIFRGLLQEAKSPDELAGVLGHEIGHVRNRDVMQSLLRQLGLSIVLGGANSNAAGYMNTLISSSYSREAEAKADTYSINLMKQSSVTPEATAGFFARLAEGEKELGQAAAALGYIASHPLSESREKAFRSSLAKGKSYTPVMTPQEWSSIVEACANDPKMKRGGEDLF